MKNKLHLILMLLLVSIGQLSFAQKVIVTGVVSDNSGPLPDVSVVVKGTADGTTTDFDGNFSINTNLGKILVISYLGYQKVEVTATNEPLNILLVEYNSSLDEIVVVGYRKKEKKKLTSAVSTIDNAQIENLPVSTFDNILQGLAPGINVQSGTGQPGRAASILIRGFHSLSLTKQPLFIIDGQAISQDTFATINPNDIESVSVLKDAAATQIYGSRGSNGVMVITTKSGKQGKTQIEYKTYTGISIAPKYNDALQPLTSSQLINLSQEIGSGGVVNVGATEAQIEELRTINEDWLDVLTRNGETNSHELSLSGGNENIKYYLSGAYFSQEGIALRSKLDRYSLRSKVDYSTGRFNIAANIYLAYTDSQDSESEGSFSRSNPFYASIRTPSYDRAIDPITGEYALPLDLSASSTLNNLERTNTNDEDRFQKKVIVGLHGHYEFGFLENLSFDTKLNMDYSEINNRTYTAPNSVAGGRSQGGQGSLNHFFSDRSIFTITNSLIYKFNVTEDHQFDVRLYQEYIASEGNSVSVTAYGLNPLIETIAGATEGTEDNGFIPNFSGGKSTSALTSYFATLDYSFLDKYYFTAGVRRDGSSRFGSDFQFGNFYSAGLGWIISEENFLSSVETINYLKFRASYGTVGNESISTTAAFSVFSTREYNGTSGIVAGIFNRDLKWEQTAKANIGIDLRMLNNRLSFNLDVYSEKTTDLLQNVPISRTSGFSSQFRNIGSLKNEGVELSISSTNIDTENFKWKSTFNIATNETTVLKLNKGESFRTDRFLVEEGGSFPVFNLVKRAGVNPANGRFLWYDLDGNLTETYDLNNRVNVGRATAKYTGGFLNTFTSGRFELRALFSFSQGKKIYNVARTSLDNPSKISRGSVSTNALRFWRQPGDITDIPDYRQISDYPADSGWLEDASFVKLRTISLSYSLPNNILDNLNISDLKLSLQGQNLFTWTQFSGLDPENSDSDYVADYPSLTTYTLGVNIKF